MMINKNQFSIGVEVGAAMGITTEFLMRNCPTLTHLTVVDLWEPVEGSSLFDRKDMEELFRSKFETERRITILKGVSWDMASHIKDETLDFAFLDADHSYESVVKDITSWHPKVRPGGIFCGHDIHFPGVQQATKEIFGTRCRKTNIDNMWFVKV